MIEYKIIKEIKENNNIKYNYYINEIKKEKSTFLKSFRNIIKNNNRLFYKEMVKNNFKYYDNGYNLLDYKNDLKSCKNGMIYKFSKILFL